jgi:hypothetical protein
VDVYFKHQTLFEIYVGFQVDQIQGTNQILLVEQTFEHIRMVLKHQVHKSSQKLRIVKSADYETVEELVELVDS